MPASSSNCLTGEDWKPRPPTTSGRRDRTSASNSAMRRKDPGSERIGCSSKSRSRRAAECTAKSSGVSISFTKSDAYDHARMSTSRAISFSAFSA